MSNNERAWAYKDKSDWPPGPWQQEPDKIQWVDPETNLDCLIVRNGAGALCGYVGLPPGHPFHGIDYSNVRFSCGHDHSDENDYYYCDDQYPDVHGGLTYADACQGHICHTPAPGRPANVWWLGFDCAHLHDLCPAYKRKFGSEGTYRDVAFVKREVASLAKQLAAV